MRSIRCGRGLGDSLYLQSVVRHLIGCGHRLKVKSDWPDVFRPLMHTDRVRIMPFKRDADITAHYATRKGHPGTTQFEDCCHAAGIRGPIELRLDWQAADHALIERLRQPGRPLLVVQLPRNPMGRTDGFGSEVLPDCRVIQRLIERFRDTHTVVQVGSGDALFQFEGIDFDLANRTTVGQMIDVASAADAFLGYCSFIVPLAESLRKPALLVWSRRGLNAGHVYVRQITPQKVLHLPSSRFVVDDWAEADIQKVADGLLR